MSWTLAAFPTSDVSGSTSTWASSRKSVRSFQSSGCSKRHAKRGMEASKLTFHLEHSLKSSILCLPPLEQDFTLSFLSSRLELRTSNTTSFGPEPTILVPHQLQPLSNADLASPRPPFLAYNSIHLKNVSTESTRLPIRPSPHPNRREARTLYLPPRTPEP